MCFRGYVCEIPVNDSLDIIRLFKRVFLLTLTKFTY